MTAIVSKRRLREVWMEDAVILRFRKRSSVHLIHPTERMPVDNLDGRISKTTA